MYSIISKICLIFSLTIILNILYVLMEYNL